jgi:hypothetical protein
MKKLPVPSRFGHTIFCDDIRNEVDGKVTFVGVYSGTMIFGTPFPVQLPKFGIAVTLILAPDEDANYSFHVYLPGDEEGFPSIKFDSAFGAEEKNLPLPELIGDDPRLAVKLSGVFAPLVISGEGFIEVRAINGEEYLRVGRLKVNSTDKPSL